MKPMIAVVQKAFIFSYIVKAYGACVEIADLIGGCLVACVHRAFDIRQQMLNNCVDARRRARFSFPR